MPIWIYLWAMARAATTTDVFNAVAEPRRRELVAALAGGEQPVGRLVTQLGLAQPVVSKHLRVLREVGLVTVRDSGRHRLYQLNGDALTPIQDWVSDVRELWEQRFEQLDSVLAQMTAKEQNDEPDKQ